MGRWKYSKIPNEATYPDAIRILFILGHIGVAGAELLIKDILKYINDRSKYSCEILTLGEVGKNANYVINEYKRMCKNIVINYIDKQLYDLSDYEIGVWMSQFNIIHYNFWGNHQFIPACNIAKSINNKLKVYMFSHNRNPISDLETQSFDKVYRVSPVADYYINNKMTYIPNGIKLSKKQKDIYSQDNRNCILSIGRVDNNKNHIEVIEALKLLKEKYNDLYNRLTYYIIGSTDIKWTQGCYLELKELVKEYDMVDKVIFTDVISDKKNKSNLINKSIACIHPSKAECFSLTILEEMSHRVPVIMPKRLCNDVINGSNTILYNDDSESLCEVIKDLFSSSYKSIINDKIEKALLTIEEHTLSKMITYYKYIYDNYKEYQYNIEVYNYSLGYNINKVNDNVKVGIYIKYKNSSSLLILNRLIALLNPFLIKYNLELYVNMNISSNDFDCSHIKPLYDKDGYLIEIDTAICTNELYNKIISIYKGLYNIGEQINESENFITKN